MNLLLRKGLDCSLKESKSLLVFLLIFNILGLNFEATEVWVFIKKKEVFNQLKNKIDQLLEL
ncbi:MAG: Unknown protein [uncultured Aureispira sp.]|uniref:Uncharacterized protein n=1 Tax=uncultured Aureispira sp. TaxID=1331704 RepID=A0A6S6SVN7_9BACT|nr:MAG: Unknown protein [uncultured Aureispira sp.]